MDFSLENYLVLFQGCLCCLLFAYFTGPITYNFMNQFRMFMFPLRPAYSDGHIVMSSRPSHGLSVLFGFNWTFNCHCCVGNWLKWIFTYRYPLRLCQNLNMPVVKHPDERDKGVTPFPVKTALPLDGCSVN